MNWKAGQYGLFTITHKKIKNPTRPFTVASAPAEPHIQITTRVSNEPSPFKQALLELEPGMTINMRGPVGPFYLADQRPALLIAGGIGITPFRSMLKQVEAEGGGGDRALTLLYLDSGQTYLFKDELDCIAGQTSVAIRYLASRDDLQREIGEHQAQMGNAGMYFIAGPQSMADELAKSLQQQGIAKKNIRKDAFFGY